MGIGPLSVVYKVRKAPGGVFVGNEVHLDGTTNTAPKAVFAHFSAAQVRLAHRDSGS